MQQLCEAGEEEFLEIMALVGMASKPLHVRRLQKALQEWVANPGLSYYYHITQSIIIPKASISGSLGVIYFESGQNVRFFLLYIHVYSSEILQSLTSKFGTHWKPCLQYVELCYCVSACIDKSFQD